MAGSHQIIVGCHLRLRFFWREDFAIFRLVLALVLPLCGVAALGPDARNSGAGGVGGTKRAASKRAAFLRAISSGDSRPNSSCTYSQPMNPSSTRLASNACW